MDHDMEGTVVAKSEAQRLVDAMRKELTARAVPPIIVPLYEMKIAEYVAKGKAK